MNKEQMISIYDPGADTYREVPISIAKKFVAAAKETEAKLKKLEEV